MIDRIPVKSCTVEDHPQFAVIVDDPKIGYGIYSFHVVKIDATRNAKITGGKVVPVDWIGDEMIMPPLYEAVLRKHLHA